MNIFVDIDNTICKTNQSDYINSVPIIENINKIKSIEHSNIVLEGYNKEIPIGGSYKETFSNKMKWV